MNANQFVAPTGYVELDNDCEFSIDRKSTRSRESVDPKTDLAFYFNTYIIPKYGLDNINVNNVASFMKDLEMNWTKISPDMKDKVMNIMVDDILNKNGQFKSDLLKKLNVASLSETTNNLSTFGGNISRFGSTPSASGIMDNKKTILIVVAVAVVLYFVFKNNKSSTMMFGRLS